MNLFRRGASDTLASYGNNSEKQQVFLAALDDALPSLNRFAQAMCRDHYGCDKERAKDLVSETILKAYESFSKVREPKAFCSYLFTIAVRLNRLERKRSKRWTPLASEHSEIASDAAMPDANADVAHLYEALAKLPAEQREAIVMSEILGMKLVEVAEAQNATLGAVKTRVSRGRKRLAELLEVSDESPTSLPLAPTANGNGSANGNANLYARFAFEANSLKEKL
jgi:RNA polymerase sigma-70 factor, ECF subfamily